MDKGYKIKATYETHDPKKIQDIMDKKPLVGGTGLLSMLQDTIAGLGDGDSTPMSSPFHVLDMNDFGDDPVISAFKNMGGPENIVKIVALPGKEAHHHLHHAFNKLNNIKLAEERNTLRYAYMALQNFLNKNNEAARLERVAYKSTDKSAGYWQIEAINSLDKLKKFASTSLRISKLESARNVVLSGNKLQTTKVSNYLHNWYSEITPKENRRVAYTTLSTQANEPYLLCPKGKFQGYKSPIPMEISKCRENCIDSRVDKEGHVTCAYQDWLKVAFQSHDEVMARLDVHKHPDNEANALELKEGERSKKLTEGEIGFEARFENSDRGANKIRGKQNVDDSREKQLSDAKQSSYGHQQGDKPVMRPKQAQSDTNKTIDSQLPRKDQKGTDYLEMLLRKLNDKESVTDEVRENQLDSDGLYNHRGEMEESYADQLNVKGKDPINYRDELNKNKNEPKDSIIHQLDKNITASKKEMNQEQILNETRKKNVVDVSRDKQLEDRRQNTKITKNIEALLDAEDEDSIGHHFSEEDLKRFADELGLDYIMESKREEYDDVV
jgi:hypothetical protein